MKPESEPTPTQRSLQHNGLEPLREGPESTRAYASSEIWEEGHSTGGASDGWQNDLLGRPDAQRCGRASFSEATEKTIKSSVFGKEQKFYQSYPKNKLLILLL